VSVWPYILALPWLAGPLLAVWRMHGSPSLDHEASDPPDDPPLVSIIVPARNEAANITTCLEAILASRYPRFEVIVVDDRSEDDTGAIVAAIAARDARVRVLQSAPLAQGWFGKQWACVQGVHEASGSLYCFTDADTAHGPELLTRAVNAMHARSLDFLSVAGRQEMETFWERVVQPEVFAILALRYGGPGAVNRSPRAADKIANGQFMMITPATYYAVDGHAAVRRKVAEDLALAQLLFRRGKRTELVFGLRHLATRMYASLPEIVGGWRKNMYAGGLDAAPFGDAGRALLPAGLLAVPVASLAPVLVLLARLLWPLPDALVLWAALCVAAMLLWRAAGYVVTAHLSPFYALAFPLGSAVVAHIACAAILRGHRVEWKGREYEAG
jgi:chlorobactene glucosyltransferase